MSRKISPDAYFNHIHTQNPSAMQNNYDPFRIDYTIPSPPLITSNCKPATSTGRGCGCPSPAIKEGYCGCSAGSNFSILPDIWTSKSSLQPTLDNPNDYGNPFDVPSSQKGNIRNKPFTQDIPGVASTENYCGYYQIGKGVWSDPFFQPRNNQGSPAYVKEKYESGPRWPGNYTTSCDIYNPQYPEQKFLL